MTAYERYGVGDGQTFDAPVGSSVGRQALVLLAFPLLALAHHTLTYYVRGVCACSLCKFCG